VILLVSTHRSLHHWRRRLLAITTVGGGTAGALSCVSALDRSGSVKDTVAICCLLVIYLAGVLGGVTCENDSSRGRQLCIFFLLAQVPVIQTGAITYHVIAIFSCAIALSFDPINAVFSWFLGTDWELSLRHGVSQNVLGINVFPVTLLFLLLSEFKTLNSTRPKKAL
jgi:hypothetical protein